MTAGSWGLLGIRYVSFDDIDGTSHSQAFSRLFTNASMDCPLRRHRMALSACLSLCPTLSLSSEYRRSLYASTTSCRLLNYPSCLLMCPPSFIGIKSVDTRTVVYISTFPEQRDDHCCISLYPPNYVTALASHIQIVCIHCSSKPLLCRRRPLHTATQFVLLIRTVEPRTKAQNLLKLLIRRNLHTNTKL